YFHAFAVISILNRKSKLGTVIGKKRISIMTLQCSRKALLNFGHHFKIHIWHCFAPITCKRSIVFSKFSGSCLLFFIPLISNSNFISWFVTANDLCKIIRILNFFAIYLGNNIIFF